MSLESVLKNWPLVLEKIKNEKISVWTFLKEGKLTKLSNEIITITFPGKLLFYKESLERPATQRFVEKVLVDVFARRLGIKCIISEEKQSDIKEKSVSDVPDERVKTILNIFNGQIVEANEHKLNV